MNFSSSLVGCVVTLALVAGCSKPSPEEQKKREAELAAALASAMATPSASATTNSAPAAPGGFVGSCTDKESHICNEYTGALPLGAEDSCKLLNGVFSKTDHCPTDKMDKSPLAGICTIKGEGDDRVKKSHSYQVDGTTQKATAESAKMMCDVQNGTFVAAAPVAAAAAPAAAKPKKK